jgi:hypothetical protein
MAKTPDKVLLRDILIPAGTIFHKAAVQTQRHGDDHFEHTLGLTKDTSGELTYCIDQGDPRINEWFADVGVPVPIQTVVLRKALKRLAAVVWEASLGHMSPELQRAYDDAVKVIGEPATGGT